MGFSTIMDSNSFTGGHELAPDIGAMVHDRAATLGPAYRLFYSRPVHLVRGEGVYLYDADGTRYLDAYNNVASVGHCHPRVVEAVTRQLSTLNTHTRYLHGAILDYSQALLATLPGDISSIMYTCTGSEANDLAVRVAQHHTGGTGVIVTADAYHGNSALTSALSPSLGTGVAIGTNARTVPPPDSYRVDAGQLAARFAADVGAAIDDLERHGIRFSALLVDSIFSSDGIFTDRSVLAPALELVHQRGGVLIADEVQPGFGRTGDAMWGFERHGILPDLVTMGKPMANGIPVAAMAARPAVLQEFAVNVPYFNTFGGNPVSMAAASAVLAIVQEEGLAENAAQIGELLRTQLTLVAGPERCVGDVRGTGLYVAVEIIDRTDPDAKRPDRELARRLVDALRERQVLISLCGPGNVLKIRPPLPFSASDVDWFVTAFAAALDDVRHE